MQTSGCVGVELSVAQVSTFLYESAPDSDPGSPSFTLIQYFTIFWQQICIAERDFPVGIPGQSGWDIL